jgi:hypothetical protein
MPIDRSKLLNRCKSIKDEDERAACLQKARAPEKARSEKLRKLTNKHLKNLKGKE